MIEKLNPLFVKLGCIAVITLLLLLPLHQVESLIAERAALRQSAIERVAHGVGDAQVMGGLILTVPVSRAETQNGRTVYTRKMLRILATRTAISGSIATQLRHSGIYEIPTFQAHLHLQGSISNEALLNELGPEPGVTKSIGEPRLLLAVSDPTGIRALEGFRVNGVLLPVSTAADPLSKGVWTVLPQLDLTQQQTIAYELDLELSGTQQLRLLPLAAATAVELDSLWPSPSFGGAFAPAVAPRVDEHGFSARWAVLQLNRAYPQSWSGDVVTAAQLNASAFGVDFYQPVDVYQRDYRSIHYAVLFIALTFLALFLFEHAAGPAVHVIQYAMVGAALSVFYLVLVAVSEHLTFLASYTLAALSMTALLTVYFSGALRSRRAGAVTGAMTGVSYALLYLLVLSEEYALLFGALALFMVLAAIMIATRTLDWYQVGHAPRRDR